MIYVLSHLNVSVFAPGALLQSSGDFQQSCFCYLPPVQQVGRIALLLLHFESILDPGRSLEEKLARSLLAQIQKEQIEKGVRWLNSSLFHGVSFVPGCAVTLMLSLSFELHTAPWVPHTKEYDAPPEAMNGLPIYFLQEGNSPFEPPRVSLIIKVYHCGKSLRNAFNM